MDSIISSNLLRETRLVRKMEFMIGGCAAIGACFFTNPLEVVKTRMQLQGELQARGIYTVHYKNFVHAFYTVAKGDGLLALQKGLMPALWYQLFLNGIRLGTYQLAEKRRWTVGSDGLTSVPRCMVVGAVAGCAGAYTGSPFYLVKTHLQSQAAASIAVGHQHDHQGFSRALQLIYRQHGVPGLWRGALGAMPRSAVGSATQLISFLLSKEFLVKHQMVGENPYVITFAASMVGGIMVATCIAPFDLVMTRLYNQGLDASGKGILYNGVVDCFVKLWRTEGFLGLYKGFGPCYARLGPHTVLCLGFWDALKRAEENFKSRNEPETVG